MKMHQEAVEKGGLAVVTGAASGVGRVAALRFAQAGLGVVLAVLPGETLDDAADEIRAAAVEGKPVLAVPTDVTKPEAVMALADAAFAAGEIAVLMNNAGIGIPTTCLDQPENWRRLIEVNLFGVLNGVQAFVPNMIAAGRPAVVVNIQFLWYCHPAGQSRLQCLEGRCEGVDRNAGA
jgi:NAD(P)-dependent dehydrogenase (short-subunit alcohol dehydrogenase family)